MAISDHDPGPAETGSRDLSDAASLLLEAIPDPVLLVDAERIVQAANQAARSAINERLIGRDLILSLRNPEVIKIVDDAFEGRESGRKEVTFAAPIERTFQVSVMPLPDRNHIVLALNDITDIKYAARMRADFVANVTHELRSPLSTLVGFLETFSTMPTLDDDDRRKFLDIMNSEARRMARLIEDLLSLSKVEANEHVRPTGTVDLQQLLHAIVDSLAMRAKARRIEISIHVENDSLSPVVGDKDELTTVFQNLVDNAISYTSEETKVEIVLSKVDRIAGIGSPGARVEVRDHGDGIAPEHIPRLTERFYRVDKGRSRSMGGTGLGLAIVKHIVSHHRGRFTIDSTLGEGNTFAVELPLAE